MHTRFFFICLLLAINTSAQTYKIDSLKKVLPSLENRARINCLNALGCKFYLRYIHSDSSLKYANLAYAEAIANHYNIGNAVSLNILRLEYEADC
jgi:hypothetical protein